MKGQAIKRECMTLQFSDNMARLHGEMSRYLDSAEQACPHKDKISRNCGYIGCKENCEFRREKVCIVPGLRELLGPVHADKEESHEH
jgi:hypothetical protein